MRPDKLNFLFNPVSIISGVGPKIETLIKKFLGDKIINLLWHLPYNITIRTKHETISKNEVNTIVIIKVLIIEHIPSKFFKQPYKVKCLCSNIPLNIIFFNAKSPYIKKQLPIGENIYISGKLEFFNNNFQITHPTHINKLLDFNQIKSIDPIYGLTAGLSQRVILKNIQKILLLIPPMEEWLKSEIIIKHS